jgi:hypothetical protein
MSRVRRSTLQVDNLSILEKYLGPQYHVAHPEMDPSQHMERVSIGFGEDTENAMDFDFSISAQRNLYGPVPMIGNQEERGSAVVIPSTHTLTYFSKNDVRDEITTPLENLASSIKNAWTTFYKGIGESPNTALNAEFNTRKYSRTPWNSFQAVENREVQGINVVTQKFDQTKLAPYEQQDALKMLNMKLMTGYGPIDPLHAPGVRWQDARGIGMALDKKANLSPIGEYDATTDMVYGLRNAEKMVGVPSIDYGRGGAKPYHWIHLEGRDELVENQPQPIMNRYAPSYGIATLRVPGEAEPRVNEIGNVLFTPTFIGGGGLAMVMPGAQREKTYGYPTTEPVNVPIEDIRSLAGPNSPLQIKDIRGKRYLPGHTYSAGTINGDPLTFKTGSSKFSPTQISMTIPAFMHKDTGAPVPMTDLNAVSTEDVARDITARTGWAVRALGIDKVSLDIGGVGYDVPTKVGGLGYKYSLTPTGERLKVPLGTGNLNVQYVTGEMKGGSAITEGILGYQSRSQLAGIFRSYSRQTEGDASNAAYKVSRWLGKSNETTDWEEIAQKFNAAGGGWKEPSEGLGLDVFQKVFVDVDMANEKQRRRNLFNLKSFGIGYLPNIEVPYGPTHPANLEFIQQITARSVRGKKPGATQADIDAVLNQFKTGGTIDVQAAAKALIGQEALGRSDMITLSQIASGHAMIARTALPRQLEFVHGHGANEELARSITAKFPEFASEMGLDVSKPIQHQGAQAKALTAASAFVSWQMGVSEGQTPAILPTSYIEVDQGKALAMAGIVGATGGGRNMTEETLDRMAGILDIKEGDNRLLYFPLSNTYDMNPLTVKELQFKGPTGEEIGGVTRTWGKGIEKLAQLQAFSGTAPEKLQEYGQTAVKGLFDQWRDIFQGGGEAYKAVHNRPMPTGWGGRFGYLGALGPDEVWLPPAERRKLLEAGGVRRKDMKQAMKELSMGGPLQGFMLRYPQGTELESIMGVNLLGDEEMRNRTGGKFMNQLLHSPEFKGALFVSQQFASVGVGDFDYDPVVGAFVMGGNAEQGKAFQELKNRQRLTTKGTFDIESKMFRPEQADLASGAVKAVNDLVDPNFNVIGETIKKAGWKKYGDVISAGLNSWYAQIGMGESYNIRRVVIPTMAASGYSEEAQSRIYAGMQSFYQFPLDKTNLGQETQGVGWAGAIAKSRFGLNERTGEAELIIGSNVVNERGRTNRMAIPLQTLDQPQVVNALGSIAAMMTTKIKVGGKGEGFEIASPEFLAQAFSYPGQESILQKKLEAADPSKDLSSQYLVAITNHINTLTGDPVNPDTGNLYSSKELAEHGLHRLADVSTELGQRQRKPFTQSMMSLPAFLPFVTAATRKAEGLEYQKPAPGSQEEKFLNESRIARNVFENKFHVEAITRAAGIINLLQRKVNVPAAMISKSIGDIPDSITRSQLITLANNYGIPYTLPEENTVVSAIDYKAHMYAQRAVSRGISPVDAYTYADQEIRDLITPFAEAKGMAPEAVLEELMGTYGARAATPMSPADAAVLADKKVEAQMGKTIQLLHKGANQLAKNALGQVTPTKVIESALRLTPLQGEVLASLPTGVPNQGLPPMGPPTTSTDLPIGTSGNGPTKSGHISDPAEYAKWLAEWKANQKAKRDAARQLPKTPTPLDGPDNFNWDDIPEIPFGDETAYPWPPKPESGGPEIPKWPKKSESGDKRFDTGGPIRPEDLHGRKDAEGHGDITVQAGETIIPRQGGRINFYGGEGDTIIGHFRTNEIPVFNNQNQRVSSYLAEPGSTTYNPDVEKVMLGNEASQIFRMSHGVAKDAIQAALAAIGMAGPVTDMGEDVTGTETVNRIQDILEAENLLPRTGNPPTTKEIVEGVGKGLGGPNALRLIGKLAPEAARIKTLANIKKKVIMGSVATSFADPIDISPSERAMIENTEAAEEAPGQLGHAINVGFGLQGVLGSITSNVEQLNQINNLVSGVGTGGQDFAKLNAAMAQRGLFNPGMGYQEKAQALQGILRTNPELAGVANAVVRMQSGLTGDVTKAALPDSFTQMAGTLKAIKGESGADVLSGSFEKRTQLNPAAQAAVDELQKTAVAHAAALRDDTKSVTQHAAAVKSTGEAFEKAQAALKGPLAESRLASNVATVAEISARTKANGGMITQADQGLLEQTSAEMQGDKAIAVNAAMSPFARFARKALGGFGLMYARSIAGIITEGVGYGAPEAQQAQQAMANYANGVLGANAPFVSPAAYAASQMAARYGGQTPQQMMDVWSAKNPTPMALGQSIFAGVAAAGASEFYLQSAFPKLAETNPGAGAKLGLAAALAVGVGSFVASAEARDTTSVGYAAARAMPGNNTNLTYGFMGSDIEAYFSTETAKIGTALGIQGSATKLAAIQQSSTMYKGATAALSETGTPSSFAKAMGFMASVGSPTEAAAALATNMVDKGYKGTQETLIAPATFMVQNPTAPLSQVGAQRMAEGYAQGVDYLGAYQNLLYGLGYPQAQITGTRNQPSLAATIVANQLNNEKVPMSMQEQKLFAAGAATLGNMPSLRWSEMGRLATSGTPSQAQMTQMNTWAQAWGGLDQTTTQYYQAASQKFTAQTMLGIPTGINPLDLAPMQQTIGAAQVMQNQANSYASLEARRDNLANTMGMQAATAGDAEMVAKIAAAFGPPTTTSGHESINGSPATTLSTPPLTITKTAATLGNTSVDLQKLKSDLAAKAAQGNKPSVSPGISEKDYFSKNPIPKSIMDVVNHVLKFANIGGERATAVPSSLSPQPSTRDNLINALNNNDIGITPPAVAPTAPLAGPEAIKRVQDVAPTGYTIPFQDYTMWEMISQKNPLGFGVAAAKYGINYNKMAPLPLMGGGTMPAYNLARTDVTPGGQLTGMAYGTSSLGILGGPSSSEMAGKIFGAGWENNPYMAAAAAGGSIKVQQTAIAKNYELAMAGVGVQQQGIAANLAFTTGVGLQNYAGLVNPQTGGNFGLNTGKVSWSIPGTGSFTSQGGGQWGIEDAQRALGIAQTQFGFGMQQKQINLQSSQFYQSMGLQAQGMALGRAQGTEEFGFNTAMAAQQFGFSQTMYKEQARFTSGRERRLGEMQQKENITEYNMQTSQRQTEFGYQKQQWALQEAQYKLQIKQFEETKQLQQQQLDKAKEFYAVQMDLELQSIKLARANFVEQQKLATESAGIAAQAAKDQKDLSTTELDLSTDAAKAAGAVALLDAGLVQAWKDIMKALGLPIPTDEGRLCCFLAGTKILMGDGSERAIEDVKLGDIVMGKNDHFEKEGVEVHGLIQPIREGIWTIKFASGQILNLTNDHPMYTRHGWKSIDPLASEKSYYGLDIIGGLEIGDEILTFEEGYESIIDMSYTEVEVPTYTMVVGGQHEYYAEKMLTHNSVKCAAGGSVRPGGSAIVGDSLSGIPTGYEELVTALPGGGFNVTPNSQLKGSSLNHSLSLARGTGGGNTPQVIQIFIGNEKIRDFIIRTVAQDLNN